MPDVLPSNGGHRSRVVADEIDSLGRKPPVAILLARHGARVMLTDRERSAAEANASMIEAYGGICRIRGDAEDVDLDECDQGLRANVTSIVLMTRFAAPAMHRAGGGSIVNIGSITGLCGGHGPPIRPCRPSSHRLPPLQDGKR